MQTEPPFQLKNMYNPAFAKQVAAEITRVYPAFDTPVFLQQVFDDNWANLELKQRIRHIAQGLRQGLPTAYPEALGIIVDTVHHMMARDGERMTFEWSIFPDFVEAFGVEAPDHSIPALATLTRLASAEFAVRPFLLRYPERMYPQMLAWAEHKSAMVRRLSSEGFRPRLPWGMGVPALKKDPSPILPVLERLKNDPAETVRRSVANNLNDISKDHPALVLRMAGNWIGQHADTDWVVRHACRGLLKKGDPEALRLFGFDAAQSAVVVEQLQCTPRVRIGDRLDFSFDVHHTGGVSENIRLEYAIDYLTSTGKTARKVFKLSEGSIAPDERRSVSKYQRFQDFTTRKHYPGGHRIAILVNGLAAAERNFEVVR
jgi:3-methyladenine DNA glycosylase AlkC